MAKAATEALSQGTRMCTCKMHTIFMKQSTLLNIWNLDRMEASGCVVCVHRLHNHPDVCAISVQKKAVVIL